MYHRQISVLDLALVRFLIELIGHMMAYLFVAVILYTLGMFPRPFDLTFFLMGWSYYSLFSFSMVLIVAPLSEMNEILEKVVPVITYIVIPFSGAFYLAGSLYPDAREIALYSPLVHGMEMMRYGIFGPSIDPHYELLYPLEVCLPLVLLGLILCRIVRKRLIIE
jgi:capsular polysaccharide transport system permease protein